MSQKLSAHSNMHQRLIELEKENIQLKHEITHLKKSNSLDSHFEYCYNNVFDLIQEPLVTFNMEDQILFMNSAAKKIIGYSKTELKGKKIIDLQVLNKQQQIQNEWNERITKNEIFKLEIIVKTKSGEDLPVLATVVPINQVSIKGIALLAFRDLKREETFKIQHYSEKRFKSLTKHSPVGIYENKANGDTVFVNEKAAELAGLTVDECLTIGWYSALFDGDKEKIVKSWLNTVNTGVHFREEFRFKHKNGKLVWVIGDAVAIKNANNEIKGFIGTITDISYLKQIQNTLETSEEKFTKLFNASPDSIILTEADNNVVADVNNKFIDLTGYERSELIEKRTTDLGLWYNPKDRETFVKMLQNKGQVRNFEAIFKFKSGKLITGLISGEIVTLGNKKLILSVIRDISERKAIEDQLVKTKIKAEENERFFLSFMDFMPAVAFIKDEEGKTIFVNKEMINVHGERQWIGTYTNELFPKEIADKMIADDKDAMDKGYKINVETTIDKHGNKNIYQTQKFRITHSNNKKFLGGIAFNITKIKEYEQQLMKAKNIAEESDKLKTAFLANMSHEIRTPMNGIIGFAEMLQKENLKEESKNMYSKIIIKSSHQLLNIVNDIIDISKIETEQVDIFEETFFVNELITDLHLFYEPKAKKKKLNIYPIKSLPDKDCIIVTDRTKLRQVLTNLLSNAIKFTKEGSITYGYTLNNKTLEFFVKDTGIGIPKEFHKKIFERFRQVEVETTREYGGTGLGLSIVKAYVKYLNGKVWLESTKGKGTIFYFTIPYKKTEENLKTETEEVKIDTNPFPFAANVLIVEDEEINSLYLEEIILDLNLNSLHAGSGIEAIEMVNKHKEIDLILMDIKMPEMNGYEATKRIKKINPQIPIIAQTAFALHEDRGKSLDAGCDDYISKPIKKDDLIAIINKHLVK